LKIKNKRISYEFYRRKNIRKGKSGDKLKLRFPPENNGHIHIGHAKSICLNFGLSEKYGGSCNLRFDDTNPLVRK
jgi:glutaminyl-tRNA synthetase